ncbi:concanavalin A-like lectin/glucanase domain-containing protein [Dichomitus squalens]|uniref:Concanavalin A-like lectin/glucanase domain-containing protein n=1 Tax=Dichomitus squalens TaxID=114155 RepID=A0A4Q9Q1T6_9APHY|nr:concanavalin A-like lectin/glucanase domain-containing protein [Dichomitus squalens]TBU61157.1 concanavalin A-like lectin/glucanase domain-containing protein [Dichomitus squalens]
MALSLASPSLSYDLLRDYSGQHFFDGWDFYGSWDNLTLSAVWWLNETEATAEHLAYVNDAGRAIIRVDNTTNVPQGQDRNTIRLTTKDSYDFGSLWVFDATHLPYGCSVWPAFWAKGPNWPFDGEIDIVEGINMMSANQMAIHTTDGCTTNSSIVQTGTIGFTDCGTGSGCTVHETKPNSFGAGFAAAGGGVWATQFDVAGVFMWFWSRADVPASLTQNQTSIDISSWGTPSAAFPVTQTCNLTEFFTPQQLVLDIALCGDWAGVQGIYQSTGCSGTCNVAGPGSPAYDNAWFEINYVRAYTTGASTPTSTSTATPTTSSIAASGDAATTSVVTATAAGSTRTPGSDQSSSSSGTPKWHARSAGALGLVCSVLGLLLLV